MTILEMYNKGYAMSVIAAEFGISRSTVNARLNKCADYIPNKRGNKPISHEYVELAYSMHASGKNWPTIAKHVGFDKSAIRRAVRNYAAQVVK